MAKRTDYVAYDEFLIRAPLLPLEILTSVPSNREKLQEWLAGLWSQPHVREGVHLASGNFCSLVENEFRKGNGVLNDPEMIASLLRYLCRFSSRCTPFGTFAGFAAGRLGASTRIAIGEISQHSLHARPDMEFLMRLARDLEKKPGIADRLRYTPNSTLYRVGERWHYIEVILPSGTSGKIYDMVTIDDSGGVVQSLLEFCKCGKSREQIGTFLESDGWEPEEVSAYIESLLAGQVLVTEMEPVVCGTEYIDHLSELESCRFPDLQSDLPAGRLKKALDNLGGPGHILEPVRLIEDGMAVMLDLQNRNHLIQVDMRLLFDSLTVGTEITSQVLLGLRIMRALSATHKPDPLKTFREEFLKRYGDRTVRLVTVLDSETGIGLGSGTPGYWSDPAPFIDDLHWGPMVDPPMALINPGNPWLAGRWHRTLAAGELYLEVKSADFRDLALHDGHWPHQMTAMIELFHLANGESTGMHILYGSSGNPAYLLGRFGFADSNDTCSLVGKLIADAVAADTEAVFAEVVHLPEDRTGNVLLRPSFLEYEIPYLAGSSKEPGKQIRVEDLMLSVVDNRVILTSSVTGKRVVPCMTNAYNHQLGHLAIYKFLHLVGIQNNGRPFDPDWGDAARGAPFVPGIRYGEMVLSAPSWQVRSAEIAGWFDFERQWVDLDRLGTWKNARMMPDEMVWAAADQELYFNWTNSFLLLALWDIVRNREYFSVRPFYMVSGTPVRGSGGSHANQFIFTYKKA